MQQQLIRLWDLPTRLFHWLLAALVTAAFVTGLTGGNAMVWHGRLGLLILGLLTFRLVWGLVGSTYARFVQFVPGPKTMLTYLRGGWQGMGHNPLGALSVLALLGLLLFQTISGLFANDDIAFNGPLQDLVTKRTSDWLTGLHHQAIWLIGVLVTLHVGAVLFHTHLHKDNLITPMVTGIKLATSPDARGATGGGWLALIAALTIAILAIWIAAGGLLPTAPITPVPTW
ncbi:cytochrome b/b6 domain-containing protein [uncultured Thiodictyon sp.]|uniref:cytochrome b/b6 domain-containing protein n=1 Tax=uncultured Thiodictyon sp. TaxID=1846217 RepID=UPI0025DC178C|nr:cytochrome b/b6 domain-containing protein [uncultured Thiodictyon sp.]